MNETCVIILNYNTFELTLKFIQDLKNNLLGSFDVVVVDNDSSNNSYSELNEKAKEIGFVLLKSENNGGYAKGNNIGLKYSISKGYKYSLIVNNDLLISDKRMLFKMVDCFLIDDNIACVGPKIIDLQGIACAPYLERPSLFTMSFGSLSYNKRRKKAIDSSMFVYRLHGCCMLVKNNYIERVGLFDEDTFLYCEEEILAERLIAFNYKSFYCSGAEVIHMESSTVGKNRFFKSRQKRKIVGNSMKIYLKKYRHFNSVSSFLCILFRKAAIFMKG